MKIIIHCRLKENIDFLPAVMSDIPRFAKKAKDEDEGIGGFYYSNGVSVSLITRKSGTATVFINENKRIAI